MPDIPFPEAPARPQFAQPNPLATMEGMQGLALRGIETQRAQQAAEQQALMNKAQVGLGQIMQRHVNAETGDVDINNVLVDAAGHPDTAVLFPKIAQDALSMGLTKQQTLNAKLEGAMKKQEIMANTSASYLDKAARTGENLTKQDLSAIYSELGPLGAGVLTGDEATKGLAHISSLKMNPETLIRNMAQRSAQGLKQMEASKQTLASQYEMMKGVTPEGVPFEAPRAALPGTLPPGVGQRQAPSGMAEREAAEGGVGSSLPDVARSQAQPSGPATTPGVRTGLGPGEQAEIKPYQDYMEGKGPWRDEEKKIATNATVALDLESRLTKAKEALNEFKTGPGMETRAKLAKAAEAMGMSDLASSLLGAPGSKKAIPSMQYIEKQMTKNAFEELKTALGGQGRFTNLEVENFLKSNWNLETDPRAIETMFNEVHRIAQIAKFEALAAERYGKHSRSNYRHEDSFNPLHFDNRVRDSLLDKGLLHEGPYEIKQPGAK